MEQQLQPQQQVYQEPFEGEAQGFTTSNEAALANQSFMELRLDTRPLLRDIEIFLSSKRPVLKENKENGELYESYETIGNPLANQDGITALLNIIHISANSHVVQGNTDKAEYLDIASETRKELSEHIVLNCYEWGIHDSKLNMIIDTVMRFFRLFLSRTVDNKERDSYGQQFASKEVVHNAQKPGLLQSFAGGIKSV